MKETTEIVLAAVSLANGIGSALGDDGKLDISDTVYLMDFIMALPAAATGAERIPAEIGAITAEQMDELKTTVKDKFDIPQDKVEALVEHAMDWAASTAKLFAEAKAVFTDG